MEIGEYEQRLRELGFPAGNAGWIRLEGEDRLVYSFIHNGKRRHFNLPPAENMTAKQRADQIKSIEEQLSA